MNPIEAQKNYHYRVIAINYMHLVNIEALLETLEEQNAREVLLQTLGTHQEIINSSIEALGELEFPKE